MTSYVAYYLKAPDEQSAIDAVLATDPTLRTEDDDGNAGWANYNANRTTAIDPHVPVWETRPEYDEEGNVVTEGVREAGWFANLAVQDTPDVRGRFDELISVAANYGVEIRHPNTPQQRFAGI